MPNSYLLIRNAVVGCDVPLAKDADSQTDLFMPRDWPESKVSDHHGIGKLTTRYRRTVDVGIKYLQTLIEVISIVSVAIRTVF